MFWARCFRLGPRQAARPLFGVHTHLGLQVWVPRPLIGVHTETGALDLPGLPVYAGAAYPSFTVQGLRGEGCKMPRLVHRIL